MNKKNYKSNEWYVRQVPKNSELGELLKECSSYDAENKKWNVDLEQFATKVPATKMNEFLTAMVNKIVVQKVFDITDGTEFPYLDFQEPDSDYGDTIELIAVENLDFKGNDYSENSDLSANVPNVNTQYIYTTDKKYWKISVLPNVMKRAIVKEGQLGALIGVIESRLEFAYKEYLYVHVSNDLSKVVSKSITLPSLGVNTTTEEAKKYLNTCLQVAYKMSELNTIFNEEGMKSVTPKGTALLLLNSATLAALNVEAYASVVNSDKFDTKVFKDIRMVKFYNEDGTEDKNTLGYILDERFYKYYVPIKESTSFVDASTMITTYWLHAWIKRGYAPFINAVKFVASDGTLDSNIE